VEISEESRVPLAIDVVMKQAGKIVSLNPVKMSLEDYFMARVGGTADTPRLPRTVEIPVEEEQ